MERLLITNADGVVGSNLAQCLARQFEVFTATNQEFTPAGCQSLPCAAEDIKEVACWVEKNRPQWVIGCGMWSESGWDKDHVAQLPLPQSAGQAMATISEAAESAGSQFTIISSDTMFTGPQLFHEEHSASQSTAPQAIVARAVEKAVAASSALVVRTHIYGLSLHGAEHFAAQIVNALLEQSKLPLDAHRYATPLWAGDLADLLVEAYRRKLQGVYHLAGSERTNLFRFARELAAACGMPSPHLSPFETTTAPLRPACETSLNSRRARLALELPLPTLQEGLQRFVKACREAGCLEVRHTALAG